MALNASQVSQVGQEVVAKEGDDVQASLVKSSTQGFSHDVGGWITGGRRGGQCHQIDYRVTGHTLELLEIGLDPGEKVIAEPGAMIYLQDDIEFSSRFSDGSEPDKGFWSKVGAGMQRALAGESLAMTHFENTHDSARRHIGLAGHVPGTIMTMDLADYGGEVLCQREAFMCASFGSKVSIAFTKKMRSGLFGGEGFILAKIQGDGVVFIECGGTIVRKDLAPGEKLRLDTGAVAAMTADVQYDIQKAGGLKTFMFGGEGLFVTTVTGPGTVWIQSLSFHKFAQHIVHIGTPAGGGGHH